MPRAPKAPGHKIYVAWEGSTRRQRLPADWPKRRQIVLVRDNWTCQIRGTDCTVAATEVDHIEPGDDHRLTNLQAACHPCHQAKTIAERSG